MIKWQDVKVWDSDGEEVEESVRVQALREYRKTGGMVGAWLVDPSGYPDLDDADHEGPGVEEIDWTGFV